MKKNTSKLIIASALTAIVAYTAGAFFQFPLTSGKTAGDVSRARVYTANIVDIDADNIQERLQSDSVFCSQLTNRAILMLEQATGLAELIRKSNELAGGNDSLQVTLDALNVPYQSVLNASKAIDLYLESLFVLSDGGKVKGFEQIYNNALLGYYLVNSKSGIVDSFRDDIKNYLSESEENENLSSLYRSWTGYSVFSELLNGDSASLKCIYSQEQLDSYYRYQTEQMNYVFLNLEQLNYRAYNQERLNYYLAYKQEQLDYYRAVPLSYNQGQLNYVMDEEQLNRFYNQEQLNWILDQEQLNWMLDQEQLNRMLDQEQQNLLRLNLGL